MTNPGAVVIDREYLARFFCDRTIDEYAIIACTSLHAPEGRRPGDLLPSARTVILFGREMEEDLFSGTVSEITPKVRKFEGILRNVGDDLIGVLEADGSEAVPVRSILLRDGTIKGTFSMNHCAVEAGLGTIGDNRLLITPRFGSRLGLGAVVTSRELEETPRPEPDGKVCNHCNLCIKACPEQALTPGKIDLFRCRNVTGALPKSARPVVFRFIRYGEHIPFSDRILNRLAKRKVNTCACCLTACPHFRKRKGAGSGT